MSYSVVVAEDEPLLLENLAQGGLHHTTDVHVEAFLGKWNEGRVLGHRGWPRRSLGGRLGAALGLLGVVKGLDLRRNGRRGRGGADWQTAPA